ncbi:MAG: DNA translocase FtsK [Flavobacteriales bacterium]|nr:DNA translocase FtsK [Flavobacteriales bacterium]
MSKGQSKRTPRKGKKKNKKKLDLSTARLTQWMSSRRTRRVFGLFLCLTALLVTIAYCSYLFTWQEDQSFLMGSVNDLLGDKTIKVKNLLGKFGAIISHASFYNGFGIASFIFPFILVLFGVKAISKKYFLPLWQTLGIASFTLIWSALFFGVFFSSTVHLGGRVGYEATLWSESIFGGVGTVAILAFSLLSFILVVFNPGFAWVDSSMAWLQDKWRLQMAGVSDVESVSDDTLETIVDRPSESIPMPVSEKDIEIEDEILANILSDDDDEEPTLSQELTPEVPQSEKKDSNANEDDFSIEVEVAKEEQVLSEKELNAKTKEFGEYDPTLDLSSFKAPGIDLLIDYGGNELSVSKEELEENKNRIVETLGNYKIGISKIKATIGPTVTLYEIVPEAGVRISKIKNLEDDIALSLAALGIRIIAPIPGKGTIGIEVPNSNPDTVSMRTVIASDKFQNSEMALPIALGKTISNETFVTDLAKMPHLLMAGATGQGKSVGLNAILVSLLYKKHPSQIKFVLVDPKKVELTLFNKIERHYLAKLPGDDSEAIITDTSKVVTTLNSLCVEMDQRYDLLKDAQVRNIKEYNAKFIKRKLNPENGHRYLPYIVLVVDEFADLIMTAGKEVENPIARLAQLARAIGIHLIIATQRPSVNIITGTIKANFPARIAFRVTSKIDSRTILDAGGADQLIGRGDMLLNSGSEVIRLQCAFVDTPEVEQICEFIGNQRGYPEAFILPEYIDENASEVGGLDASDRDELFEDAARVIVSHQQGSTSLIQRKLKLGYNRAGRLIDQLEAAGIVGPFKGSKAREVLIPDEYTLEQFLNSEASVDQNLENL